jgi:hypothetical protein
MSTNRNLVLSAIHGTLIFMALGETFLPEPADAKEPATSQIGNASQSQKTPKPVPDSGPDQPPAKKALPPLPEKLAKELEAATPLNPESTVFLDVKARQVILRTEVACVDCILEMLLVPENNREHETILRIRSKAFVIHAALVALGLEPGKAAEFSPKFAPPSGPEIAIEAVWLDQEGNVQKNNIQKWIRHNIHQYYSAPLSGPPPGLELPYKNLRWDKFNNEILWYGPMTAEERDDLLAKWNKEEYRKAIEKFFTESQSRPMEASFVFVGSSIYTDEETGEKYYQAEGGHLFCTSNFPDALLDVREESSASEGSLTYEAWTERIPPKGTPVLLVLRPLNEPAKTQADSKNPDTRPDR